jgi:3-oxoacyl-[acyl-carrier protein] reductase
MMLQGKVALVTGAGQGIGRAIADEFQRCGAEVVRNDLPDDISQRETAERCVDDVVRRYGTIDILVNNAGISCPGGILELKDDDWSRVLEVNLNGTLHCARAAFRQMVVGKGGRIINLSSMAADSGKMFVFNYAYAASKGAIVAFTKQLSMEAAPHGITVNAIAPGIIETGIRPPLTAEQQRKVQERIPAQRVGTPAEVASVAAFLASDSAAYITGEVIRITGGL